MPSKADNALSPGDRLGPYTIVGLLGAGGMGEVYRARDARLNRDVALKVLRRAKADAEHLARFTREARAAGSLNHPNILTVFDVDTEAGTPYVVDVRVNRDTAVPLIGTWKFDPIPQAEPTFGKPLILSP